MLSQQGEQIVILARPSSDLRHLSATPVRVVRGDLSDSSALEDAVRDATHIFHCAACSTDWASQQTYLDANVRGTRNLLAAARKSPRLERFVHVSTTDVYGYPLVPCEEDHPFVDTGLPYNQTKGMGEAAVWKASREVDLPVTVLRPATIYGPRGKDFTVEIAMLLRQRLMAFVAGGHAPGGFTYVDNVAQAMIDASHHPNALGQAYNIADGTQASWRGYMTLFAQQLGTRPPWIDIPFDAALMLARAFEGTHRVLSLRGRPLLTRHAVYLLGRNQEFPVTKAQSSFGFTPKVSLEEGIDRSIAWLRDRPC